MTINPLQLHSSLENFALCLPEPPKWIGLIDSEGTMLANIGGFDANPQLTPTSLVLGHQLLQLAQQASQSLFTNTHGEPTLTTHLYLTGTLFLLNLQKTYYLAISYHGTEEGCCYTSLADTQQAIQHHAGMIAKHLFPPVTEGETTTDLHQPNPTDAILNQVLENVAGAPQWAVVIDTQGKLHALAGNLPPADEPSTEATIIQRVAEHINNTHELFKIQNMRSLTYSVFRTGHGITFVDSIVTPRNTYYLIIQYPPLQRSIESIAESVRLQRDKLIAYLSTPKSA